MIINPRRACAARVCLSVCPLVNISLLERLFVLKTLSHTQRATKVKKCGVFPKTAPLQRSSTPSVVRPYVQSAIFQCVFLVYAHAYSRVYIYAHDTPPRVQHFSAFHINNARVNHNHAAADV